jgi:hypothetical protein
VVIEQTTAPLQKSFTRSIDKEEVIIVSVERNTNGDILRFNYASLAASDLISGGLHGTEFIFHFPAIWLCIPPTALLSLRWSLLPLVVATLPSYVVKHLTKGWPSPKAYILPIS